MLSDVCRNFADFHGISKHKSINFNASYAKIEIFQRNPRLLMCRSSVDRVFLKAVELLAWLRWYEAKKEAVFINAYDE